MGLRDKDIVGEDKKREGEKEGKRDSRFLIFLAIIIIAVVAILSYTNYTKPENEINPEITTSTSLQIQTTSFINTQITTSTTVFTTAIISATTITLPENLDPTTRAIMEISLQNKLVMDIMNQEPETKPRISQISSKMLNSFKETGKIPQDSSDEIYFADYIKKDGQGISLTIDLAKKKILKTSVIVKVK